jgi:hypothetical protein
MLANLEVVIIKANGQKPFFVTHVTPMGNPSPSSKHLGQHATWVLYLFRFEHR